MMKSSLLVIGLVFGGVTNCFAQDPHFSQFYSNPLYLNPAFAGSTGCGRAAFNARYQWPAVDGDYKTISASYDAQVDAVKGGLGVLLLHDQAGLGTLATTRLSGIYSYQLEVSSNFTIRAALEATYENRRVDRSKLYFGDQIDPRYGFIYPTAENIANPSKSFLDVQAGFIGYTDRLYFGFAAHHLTQPQQNFLNGPASNLSRKYTGHIGAMIPLGSNRYMVKEERTVISPNILFMMQNKYLQVNLGVYFQSGPLVAGLWYRNNDAGIAMLGIQKEKFKVGYSYDFTISKLNNNTSAGAHEISIGLNVDCVDKQRNYRMLDCPAF